MPTPPGLPSTEPKPAPGYDEAYARANPGEVYRRVYDLNISNPETGFPQFRSLERDAWFVKGVKTPTGSGQDVVNVTVTEDVLAKSFPLRNPQTDAVIPGATATGQDLMVLLYSFTRARQLLRDAWQPPRTAYTYDAEGKYTGTVMVQCSEDGSFTVPADATFTAPPSASMSQVVRWVDNAWTVTTPAPVPAP